MRHRRPGKGLLITNVLPTLDKKKKHTTVFSNNEVSIYKNRYLYALAGFRHTVSSFCPWAGDWGSSPRFSLLPEAKRKERGGHMAWWLGCCLGHWRNGWVQVPAPLLTPGSCWYTPWWLQWSGPSACGRPGWSLGSEPIGGSLSLSPFSLLLK